MIPRNIANAIQRLATKFPIVALTGPRQAGKTTLLKHLFPGYQYVSLENPDVREHALKDPRGFLQSWEEKIIFDEVQLVPPLFSYLQGIVDDRKMMGQFILSGSQNFLLMKSITQSLAGRVAMCKLFPLDISEMKQAALLDNNLEKSIYAGFYPAVHDRGLEQQDFYPNYVETYLERDVQSLITPGNMRQFQTFMRMCAGHVGQMVNYSQLANSCGISVPTAKEWLSILERSYILFTLPPYFKNFNKRLVKTPKLYFYDSGLACYLLGIQQSNYIETYYQKGALLENLVIAEMVKMTYHQGKRPAFYFWRDNHQVEMDLIWEDALKLNLLEVKYSQTMSGHFIKPYRQFSELVGEELGKMFLVYSGEGGLSFEKVSVFNWKELDAIPR